MRTIADAVMRHNVIRPQTINEWDRIIQDKENAHGVYKCRISNVTGSESIWATPSNLSDKKLIDSGEAGHCIMYMLNTPLLFGFYGMPVIVYSRIKILTIITDMDIISQYANIKNEMDYLFDLNAKV